jgi:hypothetical protein
MSISMAGYSGPSIEERQRYRKWEKQRKQRYGGADRAERLGLVE